MSFKLIQLILFIFLVGIINYKGGINAESSAGSSNNSLAAPPSIDSSSSIKVCATLNACSKAKTICGSAFAPPTLNGLTHYLASAKCECSAAFYNNLTQCLECYKNSNYNYVIDDLSKWQKGCSALGVPFNSTTDSTSISNSSINVLIYVIMCTAAVIIFIIVFIIWYLKKRQIQKVEEDGNIYYDPTDYSGKKEYEIAHHTISQHQNTRINQYYTGETNSNWSDFSQNTLVNNLTDEHFTKEGTKHEAQKVVDGDEEFITLEFNTFEKTSTRKFNTLEQSTIQEPDAFKQTAIRVPNALEQSATRELNALEQTAIREPNALEQTATREPNALEQTPNIEFNISEQELSAFDRPAAQEVSVSENSTMLEIEDHNNDDFGLKLLTNSLAY
ncbi:14269_t:CDS:2 [Dentiscutata erythropus]|uniref:14269_t:CDS:1 n=1 Tax=Dentiscutata erythropus TaxID=1348616 RepID=A0A9N9I545_9GLOM|nr:14269_t:CDS:2 [Dentiscutata erythropus]